MGIGHSDHPKAVLTSDCKVRGDDGFCVFDASLMPTVPRAPTMAVADRDPARGDPMKAKIQAGCFGYPVKVADLILFLASSGPDMVMATASCWTAATRLIERHWRRYSAAVCSAPGCQVSTTSSAVLNWRSGSIAYQAL